MKSLLFVLVLSILGSAYRVTAQPVQDLIPIIDSAESVFRTAIQAYEDADFEVAERLFGVAATNYDLHRKTTAALLMQGKALYRSGRYDEATEILNTLIYTYPTSRYIPEADRIMSLISGEGIGQVIEPEVFKLGIALPLNPEGTSFSQQMFNGIHMAVDAYNDSLKGDHFPPLPRIQMIFRDTRNDAAQSRQAIRDLVEIENVDAIIGPLFSTEAIAAATEAERSQTVLIAPLATAREVSNNRAFVFQANPTLEVRGKLMARFVVRGLGINSIGIITDYTNSESLGMAKGFEEELRMLDVEPEYQYYLSNTRSWFRLNEEISVDTLLLAEAAYMPINGGNASTVIGGALGSLDRMGLGSRIRIIGNVEWHNITNASLASNYSTTYSNDFYVSPDDSLAQVFSARYLSAYGTEPTRLSFSGYDVTSFLTSVLPRVTQNPQYPLNRIFREVGQFQGLGNRIDFSNGNVNEAMFYHRYQDGLSRLLR